jgi:hypothetical protein
MRSDMLNNVISNFDKLSLNDKEYVTEIIEKQLIEAKRDAIAGRTRGALANLKKGKVKKGKIKDLYKDLAQKELLECYNDFLERSF